MLKRAVEKLCELSQIKKLLVSMVPPQRDNRDEKYSRGTTLFLNLFIKIERFVDSSRLGGI